jgi:molecular chaperone GrpE
VSGPDTNPDPSAPGADGNSGADGKSGANGDGNSGADGDGGSFDDEVLEVLDVDDEMAAMAAAFGDQPDDAGGADADPVVTELEATRRERDDYLDGLRRLQADFENYKKRMAKQQSDAAERAAGSLAEKLLPALDTADLAMAHGGGEEVKQVWSALLDALGNEGLERIAPEGGPFDPNRHDAVAHEPGDGDQEVAEVLRAGYAWKGRVLRPAMVKVRG